MEKNWEEQIDNFQGLFVHDGGYKEFSEVTSDVKAIIKKEIEKVSAEYEGKITEAERKYHLDIAYIDSSWIRRVAEARTEVLREVIALVKENREGTYTDEAGNDCWYLDDLIKAIETLNTPTK